MNPSILRRVAQSAALLLTLSACGGGGGSGLDGGTGGTGVSVGVMTKGSVIVNGVRFEDTTANITIDDTPKTAANLKNGMVVKVRGRFNDDGVSGTAESVEVENEVRGTVQTKDENAIPPRFTVVGQTVFVTDDVLDYANFPGGTPANAKAAVVALTSGTDVVEVHGQRDDVGNIIATRIEVISAPGADIDELRGRIKEGTLTGGGFTLENTGAPDIPVVFGIGFAITPAGAVLNNGDLVEIHGSFSAGTFTAAVIDREDLEDDKFNPAENEEYEVEGFVAGCPAGNVCGNTFTVDGKSVQKASGVRYENGTADDLRNGAKVEAEGRRTGSTLLADKIKFKRTRVILTGDATAVTGTINNTGNSGTVTVLGKTVQVTTVTKVQASGGITNTDRVEVRGYVDNSGNIVAEEIKDNAGGGSDAILQARVTAKTASSVTLLGIVADLNGASQLLDINDQPIVGGLTAFLNAITVASGSAPGTLVKVKGSFNGVSTITASEAEIQDD